MILFNKKEIVKIITVKYLKIYNLKIKYYNHKYLKRQNLTLITNLMKNLKLFKKMRYVTININNN